MLAELRSRSQITIPAEIIKNLGISEGDKFEVMEKGRRHFSLPGCHLSKGKTHGFGAAAEKGRHRHRKPKRIYKRGGHVRRYGT